MACPLRNAGATQARPISTVSSAKCSQARDVELARAVPPAGSAASFGREDAVGADHVAAGAHDQVIAVGVEAVAIETERRTCQVRAHFLAEHLVAQTLRSAHLGRRLRQSNGEPARLGRLDESFLCVHFGTCTDPMRTVDRSVYRRVMRR